MIFSILSGRSLVLWFLGYPEAALADAKRSLEDAREIGQAATLMFALHQAFLTHFLCGSYATAKALVDELFTLADKKFPVLEIGRIAVPRLAFWSYRQSFRSGSIADVRGHQISVGGINVFDAGRTIFHGEILCGAWPI